MPTFKQKKAFKEIGENGGNISKAMESAGYAKSITHATEKLTNSKGWKELLEQHIPDSLLSEKHKELLNSSYVDHITFPLGPKTNKEKEEYDIREREKATKKEVLYGDIDYLSDEDIKDLLAEVNCKVRRVVHGETARHVYFWSADNNAKKNALEMAYKLKGYYAPDKLAFTNKDGEDLVTKEQASELLALLNK
jgi:NAD-dependent DNA ligase